MGCIYFDDGRARGYICGVPLTFRLPLSDGRRVFMEWRSYGGPTFFQDRRCEREIDEWWEDKAICDALDWFCGRGHIA